MEEDNTIVITKKNRRLLGFLGVEHEYLVIPPEVLSRGKIRRVEAIGENAFRCSTLERVVLLDGIRSIERQAFFESGSLLEVVMPSTLQSIGPGAFRNCRQLKRVSIPEGVTELSASVFSGCADLESIELPESITRVEYCAFSFCRSLGGIYLPRGLKAIANTAFGSCTSLREIRFGGTREEWSALQYSNANVPVICSDGTV